MKEKFVGVLGISGYIIYTFATISLTFMPLSITNWPLWLDAILIGAVLFIPFVGSIIQFILWAITVPMVVSGPFDVVSVIYYIALLIYLIAYVFPFISHFISFKKGPTRHTAAKMKSDLQKKPMFNYKILEPFNLVCIEEITENGGNTEFGRCRLLGDTTDYYFYGFTPVLKEFVSEEYILRESKYDDSNVVFFGQSSELFYIFSGYIFLAEKSMYNKNTIVCRNVENGVEFEYEWFDLPAGFRGHFVDHDEIMNVYDTNGTMTIEVQRAKCAFNNYVEEYVGRYKLNVRRVGEQFIATRIES